MATPPNGAWTRQPSLRFTPTRLAIACRRRCGTASGSKISCPRREGLQHEHVVVVTVGPAFCRVRRAHGDFREDRPRTMTFLVLSALATGASWLSGRPRRAPAQPARLS